MSHRGDSQRKKLATTQREIKTQGAKYTTWYCSLLGSMCNCTPYTQNVDTIKPTAIDTEYQAVSSPRISVGAISTIDIGPVTPSAPIPRPDIIRAAYNPANPGLNMATSCPKIQMALYRRKDHRRPMRSFMKKDRAAPAASPI